MLAVVMLALLIGIAIGAVVTLAVEIAWSAVARRMAHRNRLDLRKVRPAREAGVRVTSVRLVIPPGRERLGEPPSFLPDVQALDEDPTHG